MTYEERLLEKAREAVSHIYPEWPSGDAYSNEDEWDAISNYFDDNGISYDEDVLYDIIQSGDLEGYWSDNLDDNIFASTSNMKHFTKYSSNYIKSSDDVRFDTNDNINYSRLSEEFYDIFCNVFDIYPSTYDVRTDHLANYIGCVVDYAFEDSEKLIRVRFGSSVEGPSFDKLDKFNISMDNFIRGGTLTIDIPYELSKGVDTYEFGIMILSKLKKSKKFSNYISDIREAYISDNGDSNWPSPRYWDSLEDDFQIEDAWSTYLSELEDEVNNELKIFPEPSTQGGRGTVFIFDESGENQFGDPEYDDYETPSCDYVEWCNAELEMAANSSSAEEYKNKYREFVKGICGI